MSETVSISSEPKILECSISGDKRFCPSYAMVTIHGVEKSIEDWFNEAKRTTTGNPVEKGMPYGFVVDPFTGDSFSAKEARDLYRGLWIIYLENHPDLVEYASTFDDFSNCFKGDKLESSHEEIIGAYIKGNRDFYVASNRASRWYKNRAEKNKASLREQIQKAKAASVRCGKPQGNAKDTAAPER